MEPLNLRRSKALETESEVHRYDLGWKWRVFEFVVLTIR